VFSFIVLSLIGVATPQWVILAAVGLGGLGMGMSVPSFLIAVQTSVPRQSLGTATATVQFSRSIGGTVGTSMMGVILAARLASGLASVGLDPNQTSIAELLEPGATPDATMQLLRQVVASAVQALFVAALIAAILGWVVVWLAPNLRIGKRAPTPVEPEKTVEAEMPFLE
jgi:MFS family permease